LRRVGSDTATVHGKVTQADGTPLPGGRIDFRSAATGSLVSGQIKADGTYEAPAVPNGDYKVSIDNGFLQGLGPPPPGIAPMPGSDQKYVPINPNYAKPEDFRVDTTVSR